MKRIIKYKHNTRPLDQRASSKIVILIHIRFSLVQRPYAMHFM